jgi:saccharopine dehydrogenase-like NADP-dependent oxidoreductase
MRIILIIGAGRSASSLIQYLLDKSERKFTLIIGDLSMSLAENKTSNHPNATPIALDIFNEAQRQMRFKSGYRYLHVTGAFTYRSGQRLCCLQESLVTASYVSEAMQELDAAVKENNLVFMNEIGLDPGLII